MNRVQELHLEIMKLSSFNEFDGEKVANDLAAHEDLWRGAILASDNLYTLRDIETGVWHGGYVYILPAPGKEEDLEALAKGWAPYSISWLGGEEAYRLLGSGSYDEKQILVTWWD